MTAMLVVLAVVLVPLAVALAALFGHTPTPVRPHPHTGDALETMRRRRSQDYDPYPGRPS